MADYAEIYRQMHPRMFPFSVRERQMELTDLWPDEQERIKREIDAAKSIEELEAINLDWPSNK